jgi:alpha-galactosidase
VRPDGPHLRGWGESPATEWFVASGEERDVFSGYARALADRLGRRGGRRMRVWCSWYFYYESITEGAIPEVLDGLGDLPFDIVQIDDGWQQGIGDWQPNRDFPAGMEATADRIRRTGRRAGLWLAPLIAHSSSALARERPNLLLRSADDEPVVAGINWGGPYFALDPTAAATHEFLAELIATVRGWGYDYLKLDFLYAAAYPGTHRYEMPRELAYRQAMEVIREAAGNDCYLLACGAPVVASIGLFDGIRIGPDVAEFWEDPAMVELGDESARGARNALATSCQRLWLRPAIDTDPDVVFFRSDGIELEQRTLDALRDLAQIAGFLGVSDPPGQLTDETRKALGRWLTEESPVDQEGHYLWRLGDREVDFSWVFDRRTPLEAAGRTS